MAERPIQRKRPFALMEVRNDMVEPLLIADHLQTDVIPSPFPTTRNVVIKQPVGEYHLRVLGVAKFLHAPVPQVSCKLVLCWFSLAEGLMSSAQFDLNSMELPVGNDYSETRCCSCGRMHGRDQASS